MKAKKVSAKAAHRQKVEKRNNLIKSKENQIRNAIRQSNAIESSIDLIDSDEEQHRQVVDSGKINIERIKNLAMSEMTSLLLK